MYSFLDIWDVGFGKNDMFLTVRGLSDLFSRFRSGEDIDEEEEEEDEDDETSHWDADKSNANKTPSLEQVTQQSRFLSFFFCFDVIS